MGDTRQLRLSKGLCPDCGAEAAPYRLCGKCRSGRMLTRMLNIAYKNGGVKREKRGSKYYWSMGDQTAWSKMPANRRGWELKDDDKRRRPRLGRIPVDVERELLGLMVEAARPVHIDEIMAAWGRLREERKHGSIAGNLSAIIEAQRRRQEKNARRLRFSPPLPRSPVRRSVRMAESCKDCHYSKSWGESLHCRRYPPMGAAEQPEVHHTDWCGEFRPMRPLGRDAAPVFRSGGVTASSEKRVVAQAGRSKGGVARAEKLTPERRSEIAKEAARVRWQS